MTELNLDSFTKCIGADIVRIKRIQAGRNSRVYHIEDESGENYAVKMFALGGSGHDRLKREWDAVQFLNSEEIEVVPEALFYDSHAGFAVYSFLDGTRIIESGIKDIECFLKFFERLKMAAKTPCAAGLESASEACFCADELIANIIQRALKLDAVVVLDLVTENLHTFLRQQFRPALDAAVLKAGNLLGKVELGEILPMKFRTLSGSDMGFHNALQKKDGSLFFLDFEHFGWDDPVKTIADFLLHPGMELSGEQEKVFTMGMFELFAEDNGLKVRFKALYDLYRMKWCLILLNEFLESDLDRRMFASDQVDIKEIKAEQLEKAELMLAGRISEFVSAQLY